MDTKQLTAADRYWERTLFDLAGWPGEAAGDALPAPRPVKLYDTAAWHPLPAGVRSRLGDVRRLSPTFGSPRSAPPPDAATLGALLHHATGYGRCEISPDGLAAHRLVPSAGAAYPTEVYVWLPGGRDLPAGVHYYDPAHHALAAVRAGAGRWVLDEGLRADLTGAACVVLVTMRFWKIARRYGAYAYRLATQEAGVVAGGVLAVAAALGWHGHLHHLFLDAPLAGWLGLDGEEEAVAVAIPLYGSPGPPGPRELPGLATAADLLARIGPPDAAYRDPAPLDRVRCAPFLELDAASRCDGAGAFPQPPDAAPAPARRGGFALPADPAEPVVDLADALRARSSGPLGFNPTGEAVDAEVLWRICRYALAAHPSDVARPGGALTHLAVAAHRVRGVPPGAYLLPGEARGERAEPLASGALAPRLAATVSAPVPPVNFATVNAVVSVLADPAAAGSWVGDRAYRVLNVEAGVVAQRVCVLAGAAGLVARPYNSYRARGVEQVLGLTGTGLTPLFQIAIGRPRVTRTWSLSLSV